MRTSWVTSAPQTSLDTSIQATEFSCMALCLILSPSTSHCQKIISSGISPEQEWVHPLETGSPSFSEHLLLLCCEAHCVRGGAGGKSSMSVSAIIWFYKNAAQKANCILVNIFFLTGPVWVLLSKGSSYEDCTQQKHKLHEGSKFIPKSLNPVTDGLAMLVFMELAPHSESAWCSPARAFAGERRADSEWGTSSMSANKFHTGWVTNP